MKIVLRGGSKKIVLRQTGRRGPAGEGVPTGGTTGEVLTKTSNTDYDTEWAPVPSAPVDSVNGQTGAVVLDTDDIAEGNNNLYFTDARAVSALQDSLDNVRDYAAAPVVVSYHTATNADGDEYEYEVYKILTGSFVPGLVEKRFGEDYEDQGTSGSDFKPPREHLDELYARTGYGIIANSGGWVTSGEAEGEIEGAQIKDGIIYHDFTVAQKGAEAIGFRADGTSEVYTALEGTTAQDMVDDGVINSFSFGPILVRHGQMIDVEAEPLWGSFNTQVSGRQILGQSEDGDIILITVKGVTGISGNRGNDNPKIAHEHGCYNAVMLDGGGSAQTLVSGEYYHKSSDGSGKRAVPGFFAAHAIAPRQDTKFSTLGGTIEGNVEIVPDQVTSELILRTGRSSSYSTTFRNVQGDRMEWLWGTESNEEQYQSFRLQDGKNIIDTKGRGLVVLGGFEVQGSRLYAPQLRIVKDASIYSSASVFLDNDDGQVWEFFSDSSARFGVYDASNTTRVLTIESGSGLDSLRINANGTMDVNAIVDMKQNRITNLADPTNAQDAVNLQTLDGRLSEAQRTAIDALDSSSTAADIVNALQAT